MRLLRYCRVLITARLLVSVLAENAAALPAGSAQIARVKFAQMIATLSWATVNAIWAPADVCVKEVTPDPIAVKSDAVHLSSTWSWSILKNWRKVLNIWKQFCPDWATASRWIIADLSGSLVVIRCHEDHSTISGSSRRRISLGFRWLFTSSRA